jgi:hypothetical protein
VRLLLNHRLRQLLRQQAFQVEALCLHRRSEGHRLSVVFRATQFRVTPVSHLHP